MSAEESRLPALYERLEALSAEAKQWADVEASDSTALVHVGSADPEKMRERMIEVRREAASKAKALREAADETRREIQREVDRQRSEMEARMRAAMEMLAPLQEQVKRMEEGIWTVGLYLGLGEEVVTLRTGEPAPIDTPLTLRTSVLAMDEEVAAFPVEQGKTDWQGMDYRDMEMFDRWLTEEPEHLAQVLPEPKGIVVFTPRRTAKVYHEDPILNDAMNEGNFESYWLIRNGENLYRLRTNFKVGRNLMPVTSEFTALFQREQYNWETGKHETVPIEPGTREWEKAEKAQDGKRRHFMRVALIVQGLIDRTEMFQPLHAAVNVMQQRTYDDGLVVVINDTEKALTTSREPYYDWIRRLNRDLRPGMRIIGTFRGDEWEETATGERYSSDNLRLSPMSAERPPQNTLLTIEARRDFDGQKGLVVRYQRTEQVYDPKMWVESETRPGWGHYGGYRVPKQRASAVILPTDVSIIPFDLVTEAEMTEYLTARTERHAYADSFPLLQAAVKAKQEEREAEAPFRDLLTRVLADDNGQTLDEVAPHVDALVHRFKLGNKWHRPLVSLSQEDEAKALRLIRAEYKRIVDSGADEERDAAAVAALRKHDESIMFVGRLSSGKYVAFAPQPREYGEGVVAQNLWVREHTTGKTARSIKTRDWVIPGVRGSKMTGLYADERWEDWDTLGTAADDLTDDEMRGLLAQAERDCMAAIHRKCPMAEVLAIAVEREKRRVVVYATDGIHAAPKRAPLAEPEPRAQWFVTYMRWERKGDDVLGHIADWVDDVDWKMVYVPMGRKRTAGEREVSMPWHGRGRNWSGRPDSPTPVHIDEEALATAVRVFRETREANKHRDALAQQVYPAMGWIIEQQRRAKIEAIKATFLADYPDEEMWEERRAELTKNVRPDVDVHDRWHFKHREPMGENAVSLHDREDHHLNIKNTLRRLIDAGYIEWDGLTVGDAYRLLDETVPDVYEPIAHLRLTDTESEGDS